MNIIELRIGRNVGSVPMPAQRWQQFVDHSVAVLEGVAEGLNRGRVEPLSSRTEVHRGTGTWTDANGVTVSEESAVVSLYLDASLLEFCDAREVLVELVGELASEFQQDAIAVVWQGTSTLVGSAVKA